MADFVVTAADRDMPPADQTEHLLSEMSGRFSSARGASHEMVVRWDVTRGTDRCSYQMVIDETGCRLAPGVAAHAHLLVALCVSDLVQLVAGRLDLIQAFLSGGVRLSGDLALARLLQSWLDGAEG
jgi:putative sterol carrier protein